MEINELNKKLIELEKRVSNLEEINKKNNRNKLITTIMTIIFIIVVGTIFIALISKIYGQYTNLF